MYMLAIEVGQNRQSAVRYRTRKEKLRHVFLKTVFQSVYTMFIRSAKSVYILELCFKKPATF